MWPYTEEEAELLSKPLKEILLPKDGEGDKADEVGDGNKTSKEK